MLSHHSTTRFPIPVLSFLSASEHNPRVHPWLDAIPALFRERGDPLQPSLAPIFSAFAVLEKYPLLRATLATFAPPIHYAIRASLLASDPYQHLRLQVLEKLFDKYNDMSVVVNEAGAVSLRFLLPHECVFGIIEGMLTESRLYRRELAFLFTQLSMDQLPLRLQHKMAISSAKLPLTVLPTYSSWFLCSAAEYRLAQAMQDQAVLLVNGAILLKFHGKLSGLALETTMLTDGTQLIAGCWYAPIDQREVIRDAFDRGESCLSVEGQWTFLRALDEYNDNHLLQEAQTYAVTLPEQFPHRIGNLSRQVYRYDAYETFE